jgi:hypothetical protein
MPQDSKAKRRLRRVKRERTIAFRMADLALKQRDEARALANIFGTQLEKISKAAKPASDLTITKVEEVEPQAENIGYVEPVENN